MKKYINKIKLLLIIEIILYSIYVSATAVFPYIQKQLFDIGISEGKTYFGKLIFIYIILVIIGEVSSYLSERLSWKKSIVFENELKKDFFKVICSMNYNEFSKREIGEYISLEGNDITVLEQDYLTPIVDIIKSCLMLVIYAISMFKCVNLVIAIITFLLSLLTVIIPMLTSRILGNKRRIYIDEVGRYTSVVEELLKGFKIINKRTFSSINRYHDEKLNKVSKKRRDYGGFKTLSNSLSSIAMQMVHAVSFVTTGILLINNKITVGTAVAAIGYVECFMSPMISLLYDFNAVNSTRDIKKKVVMYLNYIAERNLNSKNEFNSCIEFNNITVEYDNFVLDKFSYKFIKGKKYALIGRSGSGKSTILNTLAGYEKRYLGFISVDGTSIKNIDLSNILYSFNQNDIIFRSDFQNNVTVFNTYDDTNLELIKIIRDEIRKIENCHDCTLLSGGEKKIIEFIRMYLNNADIFIMDEPFSAVDEKTIKILKEILFSTKDKTIIMVTHKIDEEFLKDFDEILVMDKGKVIKSGSYSDISDTITV